MRQTPLFAILLLPVFALAQEPGNTHVDKLSPQGASLGDPFVLRVEEPPAQDPARLVLNPSKADFLNAYANRQAEAIAGTSAAPASAPTQQASLQAPAPKVSGPADVTASGTVNLSQPNLPDAAKGALAPAPTNAAASGAPAAPVTPPPLLPRTMLQAAQEGLNSGGPARPVVNAEPEAEPQVAAKPVRSTLGKSSNFDAAEPTDLKSRALAFVSGQKKNVLLGAGALVALLALVVMRGKRRDSASDE